LREEELDGCSDGPGSGDDVVDEYRRALFHVTNDSLGDHLSRSKALLVDHRHRESEVSRVALREFGCSKVRRNDDAIASGEGRDRFCEKRNHAELFHRARKARFDGCVVQIDDQHAIKVCAGQRLGNDPCSERISRFRPAVLTRIAEVGDNRRYPLGPEAPAGIGEQQQVEQVLADGSGRGLNDRHRTTACGLVNVYEELAIRGALEPPGHNFGTKLAGYGRCQDRVCRACEDPALRTKVRSHPIARSTKRSAFFDLRVTPVCSVGAGCPSGEPLAPLARFVAAQKCRPARFRQQLEKEPARAVCVVHLLQS
jgi:hypothetical protein